MTAIAMKALATVPAGVPEVQQQPRSRDERDRLQEVLQHRLRGRHAQRAGRAGDSRTATRRAFWRSRPKLTDLAEKARDRKLAIDDMQGATCTVTNLGGIGGTAFTPIVNYPEVCILGMARSQKELQLIDGQVDRTADAAAVAVLRPPRHQRRRRRPLRRHAVQHAVRSIPIAVCDLTVPSDRFPNLSVTWRHHTRCAQELTWRAGWRQPPDGQDVRTTNGPGANATRLASEYS